MVLKGIYWGNIGIMKKKKMETTIVYWSNVGLYRDWKSTGTRTLGAHCWWLARNEMEDKMETTVFWGSYKVRV